MAEKIKQGIKFDELHGVTPQMIDWFWANMEKCFVLWHPSEHKGFQWDPSPAENGFVGAVHAVGEQIGGVLNTIRIRFADPSECPAQLLCDHAVYCAGPSGFVIHQWEMTDYGSKHIMTSYPPRDRSQMPEAALSHSAMESSRWPEFLPELYKMWQVVKDSAINVPCNLKVKKLSNGSYAYVAENKPTI
jgi:DAPG hydrolase PhiG domain